MENSDVNLMEFVKSFLTVLDIPQDKLDEKVGKIFSTVILSTVKEFPLNEDQGQKLAEIETKLTGDDSMEVFDELQKFFKNIDREAWQKAFTQNLINYLLDMIDKMGNLLTEGTKQKLAGLVDSLAA